MKLFTHSIKKYKNSLTLAAILMTGLSIAGCSSAPLKMASVDTNRPYQVLGEGQGSASGLMLFQAIPIRENSKLVRAYNEAIQSKGGDALLNPTISENWRYFVVMNKYRTDISGTVIKYTDHA